MARRRIPVGSHGDISIYPVRSGGFEASALVRMKSGSYKQVRRRGKTGPTAKNELKKAIAALPNRKPGKKYDSDTLFNRVIDDMLAEFKKKVDAGDRSASSYRDYRDTASQIRSRMGNLTCGEAEDPGLCDETIKEIREEAAKSKRSKKGRGVAAAKRARTVLFGCCALAVLHGGMENNPVRDVERIDSGRKKHVRALEPEQRGDFRTKLRDWCDKKAGTGRLGIRGQAWRDLPDLVDAMLATGTRPGEALALTGPDVDPSSTTVVVDHHLVWIEGEGVVRQPLRKGEDDEDAPPLTPQYPSWATSLFTRRKLAAGTGPLFSTWNGSFYDPTNVAKRLREACDGIGYDWVSARFLRHTVGTHIVDAGGTSEDAADQLGNTAAVVESNYRRKRRTNPKNTEKLETLFANPAEQQPNENNG